MVWKSFSWLLAACCGYSLWIGVASTSTGWFLGVVGLVGGTTLAVLVSFQLEALAGGAKRRRRIG